MVRKYVIRSKEDKMPIVKRNLYAETAKILIVWEVTMKGKWRILTKKKGIDIVVLDMSLAFGCLQR